MTKKSRSVQELKKPNLVFILILSVILVLLVYGSFTSEKFMGNYIAIVCITIIILMIDMMKTAPDNKMYEFVREFAQENNLQFRSSRDSIFTCKGTYRGRKIVIDRSAYRRTGKYELTVELKKRDQGEFWIHNKRFKISKGRKKMELDDKNIKLNVFYDEKNRNPALTQDFIREFYAVFKKTLGFDSHLVVGNPVFDYRYPCILLNEQVNINSKEDFKKRVDFVYGLAEKLDS